MEYDLGKWVMRVWQTDSRYYIGEVKQDIFGQWCCHRSWGSRTSRRGNSMTRPANSYEKALALLEETDKRRKARGYQEV